MDTKAPSTVAKTVAFVFNEGNEEYEELIAPYIREENVYFDLDSAKEALKKGEMTVIYEVPANYLQKGERRPSANDSYLEYAARHKRLST